MTVDHDRRRTGSRRLTLTEAAIGDGIGPGKDSAPAELAGPAGWSSSVARLRRGEPGPTTTVWRVPGPGVTGLVIPAHVPSSGEPRPSIATPSPTRFPLSHPRHLPRATPSPSLSITDRPSHLPASLHPCIPTSPRPLPKEPRRNPKFPEHDCNRGLSAIRGPFDGH